MGEIFTTLALVALGGALGSAARVLVAQFVTQWLGDAFPWGTLVVNVSGALMIGAMVPALTDIQSLTDGRAAPPGAALLIVGLVGSYTTVSSFSLQTLALIEEGAWRAVIGNVLGSVLLCLAAVFLAAAAVSALMGAG